MVVCKCVFLDGKEVDITVEKDAKGSDLFDSVCKYLGLNYRDPFGLVFRGGVGPAPYNWWLRPEKTLKAQIPGKCKVWEFAFIVKFYPKSLAGLDEEVARFHIIMQIRQDLLTGRLTCPVQTMAHLCSYWLQAQYGDWASRHIDLQLADAFRYVQKGDERAGRSDVTFEEQMMQIHQAHKGMSSRDADYRFIKLAASLPNYGIHYYPAFIPPSSQTQPQQAGGKTRSPSVDSKKTSPKLTIGIGPLGIHEYRKTGNEVVYTWKSMRAVSFKQNRIVLKMQGAMRSNISQEEERKPVDVKKQKNIVKEYFLADMYQTKIVWQVIIEYHMFFRMANQKGLKGEERTRLVNSIKIKRTVPLVGEKKAEALPVPSTYGGPSRPKSQLRQPREAPGPKRSASVPVRRGSGQRSSLPLPVPHKTQLKKSTDRGSVEIPPLTLPDEGFRIGETSEPPTSHRSGARMHSDRTVLDTPMSGTFSFPQRSSRHQPTSIPYDSTSGPVRKDASEPLSSYRSGFHHNVETRVGVLTPATDTPMSGSFHFPLRSSLHHRSSFSNASSSEDILELISNTTDNTEDLCSPRVLEDNFYSGYHAGQSQRGRSGAPSLRDTPKSSPRSKDEISSILIKDGRYQRSRTPSPDRNEIDESPIVIPAEILVSDLVESKRLREETGYQSSSISDFPMELDFMYKKRRSYYAKDAALMDIYDREFEKQSLTCPLTERRAQSMHSLRTMQRDRSRHSRRDRSTTPERDTSQSKRCTLESAVPAQLSSRSEKRGYSQRAKSESTLIERGDRFQTLPRTSKNPVQPLIAPTAKRRSHSQILERKRSPRGVQSGCANTAM